MIQGPRVTLRPFEANDIDDVIRWMTVDREFMNWDAPWEDESDFDPEAYRAKTLAHLETIHPPVIYHRLEIELNETGEHIGWVNRYHIDDQYEYTQGDGHWTFGIDIPEIDARGRGYGTEAAALFIAYAIRHDQGPIFAQTWSGNHGSIALLTKLGFELIDVDPGYHEVRGERVDGYTYRLNLKKFGETYHATFLD